MINYFKFLIPLNADGTRATYSPGWHGTMPKCPKNVTVLLYNDKEGWGIAQTTDSFKPPEVIVIEEVEVLGLLSDAALKDEDEVYFGDKLVNRVWGPSLIPEPEEEG